MRSTCFTIIKYLFINELAYFHYNITKYKTTQKRMFNLSIFEPYKLKVVKVGADRKQIPAFRSARLWIPITFYLLLTLF